MQQLGLRFVTLKNPLGPLFLETLDERKVGENADQRRLVQSGEARGENTDSSWKLGSWSWRYSLQFVWHFDATISDSSFLQFCTYYL